MNLPNAFLNPDEVLSSAWSCRQQVLQFNDILYKKYFHLF